VKSQPALYAVILAGGGGTRLWPLSRQQLPKHLLPVCSDDSMLAQTWERLRPLVPAERMLVITVQGQAETACTELDGIPAENIIVEPAGRGTAPCIGLAALWLQRLEPDAVMIVLPADHAIQDGAGFRGVLRAAVEAAQQGHLVTLGIAPTGPETGYGYIHRGELLAQGDGRVVYRVQRFTEKPDLPTATAFVETGQYYWNSGIFIWKAAAILEQIQRHLPTLHEQLMQIRPALGKPGQAQAIERVWRNLETVSVDAGVMERAQDVVVIPADVGWSDVGCWTSVADLQPPDERGNVLQGEHIVLDSDNTFIRSAHRLVAAVGLRDMVIVETKDAVLVCPKHRVQDVKKIVEQLKLEGKEEYL
jgi:mannose-1-phosphate guanylyltransferase